MKTSKRASYPKANTAGKRAGMKTGNAPHPTPISKVHDAGFTYAKYAKSNPKVGGH